MSFGKIETPVPERKPWNVDDLETSSNQQNIVLPYFAGVMKCPVDWVTDAHNWTSRTVNPGGGGKGGKGGSGGENSQKNWYCNIAGVTNFCPDDAPNDALLFVLVNGELASSGPLFRAPGSHYVAFSLAKFCPSVRFYWGTKDQPFDDLVLATIGGELHSAYRNQGLFTAKQWFTGSTPNVQSLVLGLARGTKFFASRFEVGENGVNPMGMPYEIFTDEAVGFGLPASRLVEASFQATADSLDALDADISPALTQARSGPALLAEVGQYFDGWFRRSGDKIEAGFFSHGDVDVDALPELDSSDIVGEAELELGSVRDTKNAVWVTYTNREKFYKDDDTERVIDYENYLKRGFISDDRIDRRWILYGATALRHGAVWARVHSKEKHTASVNARRHRVEALGLRHGDRFKTSIDSLGLSFVWRIMARDTPSDRSGVMKLAVENERGIYPSLHVPDPAPGPPGFTIIPSAVENARIVQLPTGLKPAVGLHLQVLWQRPSTHILGAKIHLSSDDELYHHLYTQQHFCAYGELAVSYPVSTPDLDTTIGLVLNLSGEDKNILASQTDLERDDDHLLLWINGEIISVGQVTALGGDQFKLFNRRARYGTAKTTHAVGSPCYIINRAFLEPIAHSSFVAGATRYFKLQPYIIGSDLDLEDVDSISYTFAGGSPIPAPDKTFLTLSAIGLTVRWGYLQGWAYARAQDIVAFDVRMVGPLYPDGETRTIQMPAVGDEEDLFTVYFITISGDYYATVRAINRLGEPSDWNVGMGIGFLESGGSGGSMFSYSSYAELEAVDIDALIIDVGKLVFLTIDDSTQLRQLQDGAPAGSDRPVAGHATKRWRKTGGF